MNDSRRFAAEAREFRGNVDSLAGTPYGRLLSLKILLFSVTVVLALINRFRLLPRLRREPPSSAPIAALARCSSSRRSALLFLPWSAFSAPGPQPFTTIADNEAVDRCPAPRRQSGSRGLSAGAKGIRTRGPTSSGAWPHDLRAVPGQCSGEQRRSNRCSSARCSLRWDRGFESLSLQRRVCELSVPLEMRRPDWAFRPRFRCRYSRVPSELRDLL